MRQEVLRMERVSCQEQGVVQLDGFNLSILSGEIMGLLPVNNHGLTSLLRLLQRNTPLRYGYVYYREEQVNTWRAGKQRSNRIGLIQSESCLVEGLTVADNIFVLRPEFKTWFLRPSILKKQLLPFLESIGVYISADTCVGELSPFEKVVVDVLKSVVAGCRLIVLRDMSADLCEAELKKIHQLLKHYAKQGLSFLYIDFHFEELRQICDKVALMSNGRIIKVLQSDAVTPDAFSTYTKVYKGMVKRQMYGAMPDTDIKSPVFEVENLTCGQINDLSFSAAPGECVVLQNVDIQACGELLAAFSGETPPKSGRVLIKNQEAAPRIGSGLAVIQELPTNTMLFNEMSYLDNLCFLLDKRMPEIWYDTTAREGVRREYAALLGDDIFDMRIDTLSEMQKYELVYMRICLQKPSVVFCVQPFRRADVELRMHIWGLIKMLINKGMAVVILAVNLADSLSLADKLIRIKKDKPAEVYSRDEFPSMSINVPWLDMYSNLKKI